MSLNYSLQELPFWHARSFYAMVLTLVTVTANALGYDVLGFLSRFGLGDDQYTIITNIEVLMPLAFALWAWLERRAPNYRLVWRRSTK